jgi:2'-5' RNA ligase
MTTILTLELDGESQAHFESLRRQHYPTHLNRVPAHITLFHQLPPHDAIVGRIHRAAHRPPFQIEVTGLRSLGRGVAYTLASAELQTLHAGLARQFEPHLIPQDRQAFHPHLVIQNKATPEQARTLLDQLQAGFRAFEALAAGLTVWNYLGGPWERAGFFHFR